MKAIVLKKYGTSDDLALEEIERPTPTDDEVLIKVRAASINDWDWALLRGRPFIIRMIFGAFFKPKIKILGVDIAGRVIASGKNVKIFKPGDHVYGDISESGFGGFAEYVCANENVLTLKPADMSFEEAAAIPHAAALTLQGLIDEGQIQDKQKILINGAGGGVGTFGIQIAKLYNAEVTGVDSSEKLDMMRAMGFDYVIDYKEEDFTKNDKLYDLILDTKTNRSPFDYVRVLKPGGRYVTVGSSMARLFQAVILGPLISLFSKKHIQILSLKPNKDLAHINELFNTGKVKPVLDGPYKLDEVPRALEYFGKGNHKGKVIISISE